MQKTDEKGVFTVKSSIFDEIQNAVYMFQLLNDLTAIAMVAVSTTAIPAIASEKIATQSVFKSLMKFLINMAVMQAIPNAAEKIMS